MTINARWHEKHRMPKNPTLAQRLAWHRAHLRHCACRPIPPKLAALLEKPFRNATKKRKKKPA